MFMYLEEQNLILKSLQPTYQVFRFYKIIYLHLKFLIFILKNT